MVKKPSQTALEQHKMTIEELNNSTWVKVAPSEIHGVGIFAIREIPEGTKLTDHNLHQKAYDRIMVVKEYEFFEILPEIRELILSYTVFEPGVLLPFVPPNCVIFLRSLMNHSDNANSHEMVATKDIKKGEEVTQNYNLMVPVKHDFSKNHYKGIL